MLKPLKRLLAALAVIAPFSIASIWSSPAQTTHAPLPSSKGVELDDPPEAASARAGGTTRPSPPQPSRYLVFPFTLAPPDDQPMAPLREANIAFNSPNQAVTGAPFIVRAKLSARLPRAELEGLFMHRGTTSWARVKLLKRATAELTGGMAFDISPKHSWEQATSDDDVTEWDWQVTPKSSGDPSLMLLFSVPVVVDGQQTFRTYEPDAIQVSVSVGWPQTVSEWLALFKAGGTVVAYLCTTVVFPITAVLWSQRFRGREAMGRMDLPNPRGRRRGIRSSRQPRG